jgi:hypothetical protein
VRDPHCVELLASRDPVDGVKRTRIGKYQVESRCRTNVGLELRLNIFEFGSRQERKRTRG